MTMIPNKDILSLTLNKEQEEVLYSALDAFVYQQREDMRLFAHDEVESEVAKTLKASYEVANGMLEALKTRQRDAWAADLMDYRRAR